MEPCQSPPAFLSASAPVPIDVPFTRRTALVAGASDRQLARWVCDGRLNNPIRGVYHATQLPDGLDLRIACLRLVTPEDAVVTDRTAGWLHGASMILAPNDHLAVPRVSMFRSPGYRLRNSLTVSGERNLTASDIVDLGGLRATSILRTSCDVGRLLHRDQALAAMDALARVGDIDADRVIVEVGRFKGYRNVRQLRALAPLVDGRSQSPAESILRLRWIDCADLPRPRPQVPVVGPDGMFYLDLGVEDLRFAAEYDGARWHDEGQRTHDHARRTWLRDHGLWRIEVFVDTDLFGRSANVESRLRQGIAAARREIGRLGWTGADRPIPGVSA